MNEYKKEKKINIRFRKKNAQIFSQNSKEIQLIIIILNEILFHFHNYY